MPVNELPLAVNAPVDVGNPDHHTHVLPEIERAAINAAARAIFE